MLALALAALALALPQAQAQQAASPTPPPLPTASASGHAVTELSPTLARIDYTTTTFDATAGGALTLNGQASDATLNALALAGVPGDAFALQSLSLSQVWNSTILMPAVLIGYSAVRSVRLTLWNLSLVAPAINAVVAVSLADAATGKPLSPNTLDGIAYDVSADEWRGAYLESLSAATNNAMDALFAMTDAVGMRPGQPISLNEASSGVFSPQPLRFASFAGAGVGSSEGLDGGPIKVSADVSTTWIIVPRPAPSPPSPPFSMPPAPTFAPMSRRALGGLRVARV